MSPLVGTGPLDGEVRILAEDATLTALDNVVEACLDHDVEFLLLTGAVFGCGRPTLRARSALLSAFENLREFEVRVFWGIGREELAATVDVTSGLPDNVTPIHSGDDEPVAIVRQGRVIASVCSAQIDRTMQRTDAGPSDHEERRSFRVGLAGPVDDSRQSDSLEPQTPHPHAFPVAEEEEFLGLRLSGARIR